MSTTAPSITTTTTTPRTAEQRAPLRPARALTGAGTIGWVGPLLAVAVIAVGVVLGQDALTALRGRGTSWIAAGTTGLDGLAPASWLVAIGVVLLLVGLWLLVTGLRPRTRDALVLAGASGAHLRTSDVARLASGAAGDVDGVLSARSSATRRTVTVTVVTTGQPECADAARAAAEGALGALTRPPRVRVRATSPAAKETS